MSFSYKLCKKHIVYEHKLFKNTIFRLYSKIYFVNRSCLDPHDFDNSFP